MFLDFKQSFPVTRSTLHSNTSTDVVKMLSMTAVITLSLHRLNSPILSNISFCNDLYISTLKPIFFPQLYFLEVKREAIMLPTKMY